MTGQDAAGRPAPGAPTLDDVARRAGVSRATASRAVNGGPKVSPAARAAVAAAVDALAYSPNGAARSLATRRTNSVALLVPEEGGRVLSDPFFAETLRGVTGVLVTTDLQLVLLLADARTHRYLRDRNVDGVLVVSHHRDDHLAESLADLRLPCVFGGRPWTGAERVSYVDTDNVLGGSLAARRLLDRGCRHPAAVAGPADMSPAVDRLAGWRRAVEDAGRSVDAVEHGDFTVDGGARAADRLLAAHPDVDGIAVASDLMAVGVLDVLARRGRRVPDDVAVVGYDDLGVAASTRPPLTTVRNPAAAIAELGTRMLLERLDGLVEVRHEVLPPSLVVRTSA